jgi:acyl dehydratase
MTEGRQTLTCARISKGDPVAQTSLQITFRHLVVNAGASWEMFPGHHDRDYARAHGHEDVFANTSLLLGFCDRVITEWAGPRARIARRGLSMLRPVHPGDQLRGSGTVVDVSCSDDECMVVLEIHLETERGSCARASATLLFPHGHDGCVSTDERLDYITHTPAKGTGT